MTRPSERLKNKKLSSTPAKGLQTQGPKQSLKLKNVALESTGHLQRSVKGVARKLKTQMSSQLASKLSSKSSSKSSVESTAAPTPVESGAATAIKKLPFVKDTKGSRLALNLLLVRPWFLLAGFWVVSLVSAAVAWEGMISPKILTMDLPQPATENASGSEKNSFLSVEQAPAPGAQTARQDAPTAETATEVESPGTSPGSTASNTANSTGGFPTWPIGAIVGTCAAGCLVMSRRRAMVRMAASRSQGKRRVRPKAAPQAIHRQSSALAGGSKTDLSKAGRPLKVVATRKPKRSPQRVQPKGPSIKGQPARLKTAAVQTAGQSAVRGMVRPKKRRQRRRPAAVHAAPRPTADMSGPVSRSFASRSNLQRSQAVPTAQSRPQKRKPSSLRGLKRNQSVVSVVPASESNALDWRNGSLAHQLDVRPQRTASM